MNGNQGIIASERRSEYQYDYNPVSIRAGSKKSSQETELVNDYFRRRHDMFSVKFGWEPVRADGMESDGYDLFGRCDYILSARSDGKVGAGCRLIWHTPTPTSRLPVQDFLNNPEEVKSNAVEISRMVSTPEASQNSKRFLWYLLGYLSEREVPGVYVTIRERLLKRYEHSGFYCYKRLPGKEKIKINRNGREEHFLPVWIDLDGYQEALKILSQLV